MVPFFVRMMIVICFVFLFVFSFVLGQEALDPKVVIRECEAGAPWLRSQIVQNGQYTIEQEILIRSAAKTANQIQKQTLSVYFDGERRRLDQDTIEATADDPEIAGKLKVMIGSVCTAFSEGRVLVVGKPAGASAYSLKELKPGQPRALDTRIAEILGSPYTFQGREVVEFLKDPNLTIDRVESSTDGAKALVRLGYHRKIAGRQPDSSDEETGLLIFEPARHWALVRTEWTRKQNGNSNVCIIEYEGTGSSQKKLVNTFTNPSRSVVVETHREFKGFHPGAPDPREFTLAAFGLQEATATEPIGDVVQRDRNVWLYGTILAAVLALIAALVLRSRARRSAS